MSVRIQNDVGTVTVGSTNTKHHSCIGPAADDEGRDNT